MPKRINEPSAAGVAWAVVRLAVVYLAYWIGRLAERVTRRGAE